MASHGAAMQAIKRFRRRELADLMGHLRIFGALPEPAPSATPAKLGENIVLPNPFLPKKNPKTGNWRPPKYSLRRQAELVKMAKISGTLSTLPPGPKTFAAKLREERVQNALRAAIKRSAIKWDKVIWAGEAKPKTNAGVQSGTRLYAGRKRMFKGHLWERKRAERIKKHTILMRDMAARVERYKNYYKKRRPNPLKPSRSTKPPKLPF
ncbi:hypothetical protein CVT26_005993 [Gymnopilus dilepis]|uniref:Large ribosomal subunit protein mL59 domain-containing protein n=1 Tax=Gymnopilus dilepis TaxID=231916 RepID=A0A409Y1A5_9AGAR|nr:hypothetical protein CVT26_005993 [Gymnopilus dilepis]